METDPFITMNADVTLGDAIDLVQRLLPSLVVVQAVPLPEDDEDDDLYFVFNATDLARPDLELNLTLRDSLLGGAAQPASVFGFTHSGLRDFAAPGAPPIVVMQDGIVSEVLPAGTAALAPAGVAEGNEGESVGATDGELDTRGGGDGLSPLAVAVDYTRSVVVDSTLSLLIRLTRDTATVDAIPIAAEMGDVIDIVVSPRQGFVVEGSPDGQLQVTDEAEPLPIHIKLRATALGPGRITVYAFREGAALGSLTISPEVVAPGTPIGRQTRQARGLRAAPPPDADLTLYILEQRDEQNRPTLEFRLTAKDRDLGLNLKPFGPIPFETSPTAYFTDFFTEIEQTPLTTKKLRDIAIQKLEARGAYLFAKLFPPDLQALLWGLQDRITTVLIQSEEPWVPWEMCRLFTTQGGRVVGGKFFCEAFQVTRWIPGDPRIGRLTMTNVGLIVPPDSGLPAAEKEATMVRGLASPGRSVIDIPPDYGSVREAFSAGLYDAIHFVGHGAFPDASDPTKAVINLSGNQTLGPVDLAGEGANLGLNKPLVFFNACQSGRQSMALTGAGGWAREMVRSGAGAFIGAHWEVTDSLAAEFAQTFYARLDAGDSVSAASHQARLAIRETGDPTWLAYTVFAEPTATLG
jgi:hypothetical protein